MALIETIPVVRAAPCGLLNKAWPWNYDTSIPQCAVLAVPTATAIDKHCYYILYTFSYIQNIAHGALQI